MEDVVSVVGLQRAGVKAKTKCPSGSIGLHVHIRVKKHCDNGSGNRMLGAALSLGGDPAMEAKTSEIPSSRGGMIGVLRRKISSNQGSAFNVFLIGLSPVYSFRKHPPLGTRETPLF